MTVRRLPWLFAPLVLFSVLLLGTSTASGRAAGSGATQQVPPPAPTSTTAPPMAEMPVSVAPAPGASPSAGKTLPVTGAELTGLSIVGSVLLGSGAIVMVARRRTSP